MTLTNYWWLLIWLFIGGFILFSFFPMNRENVCGKIEERWNIVPAVILVIPYIIWAGFRIDSFGDTGAYRESFFKAPSQLGQLFNYISTISKDKGFAVLTVLMKCIFGNSDVLYFLIIAAIQMLILAFVYRKYSCNYWMSIFFFVAATDYMSWLHNGMRQFLAITVIMAGIGFLLKKKYIQMICIILLASTFHASALLMIPVVFIVQGKAWNKKTVFCISVSVCALFFVGQFTSILDSLLSNTQYSNMVTDWQDWNDDGTNPLRVLVYSVPMILSIIGYRQIKQEDDPVINVMVNFSIFTASVALISMVTSGVFIGRVISYGSVFSQGILLPWEIKNLFTKESSRIVGALAIVMYVIFFYYQMHVTWGLV